MLDLESLKGKRIALYGLGTETERFISEHGNELDILCLLDGYRQEGSIYGYEIWSLEKAIEVGIDLVLVIARPGSCKAIVKRIGDSCRAAGVSVLDVRGNDLLVNVKAVYNFENLKAGTKAELLELIKKSEVVSFDLFDTLVTRKTFVYTDTFELVGQALKEKEIVIDDFAAKRLAAEKELSTNGAPKLEEIYERVLESAGEQGLVEGGLVSSELVRLEYETDASFMCPRQAMVDALRYACSLGKIVFITTDSYYSRSQIQDILDKFNICGYEEVIVSCEYGKSKPTGLFEVLKEKSGFDASKAEAILHVGDDEYADIEAGVTAGITTFRIYSPRDFFYALGGLEAEKHMESLVDDVKVGLAISRLFSDPFCFEKEGGKLSIDSAKNMGYAFIGPLMADFTHWFRNQVGKQDINGILFCARDGFLLKKLYEKIDDATENRYFLTSRTAAIRAGMENEADIEYVDSMRFFGDSDKELKVRFGIEADATVSRNDVILDKSRTQRINYQKYIEGLGLKSTGAVDSKLAVFDFVAKGTTQLFVQKLFKEHLKGLYFLQLEPEFMKNKGLDIVSFYSDLERDSSTIFDDYYILETIVTSPDPSVDEFDSEGKAAFARETRPSDTIACVLEIQQGIEEFFDDYIAIVPEALRQENKSLDEALLSLVKKVRINDDRFYKMVVEDPFFGRMTDINDVL